MNATISLQQERDKDMEGNNLILLIYASLHRYGSVKGKQQAIHPKSLMLKSLMKLKDFTCIP